MSHSAPLLASQKQVLALTCYAELMSQADVFPMRQVSTKTLLEEPRAELTALHTLPLLLAAGLLDEVHESSWPPCASFCS